jgi:hypothetical protein
VLQGEAHQPGATPEEVAEASCAEMAVGERQGGEMCQTAGEGGAASCSADGKGLEVGGRVEEAVETVEIQAVPESLCSVEWHVPNGQLLEVGEGEPRAGDASVVAMEEEIGVPTSACGGDAELGEVWADRTHHKGVDGLAQLRLLGVEAEPLLQGSGVGREPLEVATAQGCEPIVLECQRPHQACEAGGCEEGAMEPQDLVILPGGTHVVSPTRSVCDLGIQHKDRHPVERPAGPS